MPKDRFPLYMWMSAAMSVATPFVLESAGGLAVIGLWTVSTVLTVILMLQDRRRPDVVIYPSQVKAASKPMTAETVVTRIETAPVMASMVPPSAIQPQQEEFWAPHDFETPTTGISPSP